MNSITVVFNYGQTIFEGIIDAKDDQNYVVTHPVRSTSNHIKRSLLRLFYPTKKIYSF